jgi:type II secretory pathway pseudopilin PulG
MQCQRRAPAFTLVELLVVIGIITILISILLPVVSRVRYAAYTADTQNEISQLSNACTAYYSTYHAYPGPLSNDYIDGQNASTPGTVTTPTLHLLEQYVSSTTTPISLGNHPISGSENLVLGLMGGLRLDPTNSDPSTNPATAYRLEIAPTEVGLGPLSLNPSFPGRTPSFFSTGSNYLMWCENNGLQNIRTTQYQNGTTLTPFVDAAGTPANDSPIPVFVDRFPAPGPLPILYLRARTGAKGIVWDNSTVTADPNGNIPYYQYDLRDITPYTYSHIGLPTLDTAGNPNSHNLIGISIFPPNPNATVVSATKAPHPLQEYNAGAYFMNTSITPTNTSTDPYTNFTGRPRAVDQFILISAGRDGVYGTADDITSFGDVSQ